MSTRISAFQHTIAQHEAVLLSRPADISYFTNFSFLVSSEREALLLITKKSAHLLYTAFSPVVRQENIQYHAGCYPGQLATVGTELFEKEGITQLAYDEQTLVVSEYHALERASGVTLTPLDRAAVWKFRMIKDADEQARCSKACHMTTKAVSSAIKQLKVGMSELAFAQLLESELRARGVLPVAFPTIVAFGDHTALPHHQPTARALTPETPVLIDIGGTAGGYAADMTRTFWYGEQPSKQFLEISTAVHEAYSAALSLLQTAFSQASETPIIHAKDIDTAARSVITAAGYGAAFIHTTGHGLGLEIHEQPSLSAHAETLLQAGMTLTIEPGIYLPGKFGYRHENTVLLDTTGIIELTLDSTD